MTFRKLLSPTKLLGTGVLLALVTATVLWVIPSDEYLLLPATARPVAPLVAVKGGKDPADGGGIYYDAVIIRRAKLFEQLFPWIHDGVTLVPAVQINPPGVSDRQRRTEDLREMARSQDVAAAVALRYLGYHVVVRASGALIEAVYPGSPAAKAGLEPTDVIVAVDGKPVEKVADLRDLMSSHRPGDTVHVTLRSSDGLREVRLTAVAASSLDSGSSGQSGSDTSKDDSKRPVIGVTVGQATQLKLPFAVSIDAGSIGGPSAGLAFALDVLEELGRDVDRGYRVAATGELDTDGLGPPDRRSQAKGDRCEAREGGRLPCACWG